MRRLPGVRRECPHQPHRVRCCRGDCRCGTKRHCCCRCHRGGRWRHVHSPARATAPRRPYLRMSCDGCCCAMSCDCWRCSAGERVWERRARAVQLPTRPLPLRVLQLQLRPLHARVLLRSSCAVVKPVRCVYVCGSSVGIGACYRCALCCAPGESTRLVSAGDRTERDAVRVSDVSGEIATSIAHDSIYSCRPLPVHLSASLLHPLGQRTTERTAAVSSSSPAQRRPMPQWSRQRGRRRHKQQLRQIMYKQSRSSNSYPRAVECTNRTARTKGNLQGRSLALPCQTDRKRRN